MSDKRHSSPSPRKEDLRPRTHRKRSCSVPMVEALGCSTTEAELILAEGRAAVRSRQPSVHRRARRTRDGEEQRYRPAEHLKYLDPSCITPITRELLVSAAGARRRHHHRFPSDATNESESTVVADDITPTEPSTSASTSPLGAYSANLAKFVQSQLNSIATYLPGQGPLSPKSCPDLHARSRTPLQSPTLPTHRSPRAPQSIEIPPTRPPLVSQFSAWSSTGDDSGSEVPSLPSIRDEAAEPTYLQLLEHVTESSFFFPTTPLSDDESDPDTARRTSFPVSLGILPSSHSHPEESDASADNSSTSSSHSPNLHFSNSSAPSFSSASTGSYFDYKRPLSVSRDMCDRVVAAVSTPAHYHEQQHLHGDAFPWKLMHAISPYEGGVVRPAVDNVLVESQQRVRVDGMAFDMLGDVRVPTHGFGRMSTPIV